jgi:hypothetical protein
MFNAARPTVFLFLEGNSDRQFWASRVDTKSCQLRACGGKAKAIARLDTARAKQFELVLAVLDADFDRLENSLVERDDLVWVDFHDLDMLLLASPALEKVLSELPSPKKREDFEKAHGPIRQALLERARDLGRFRLLSKRKQLGLTFRKRHEDAWKYLDYEKFCPRKDWSFNRQKMIKVVCDFSQRHDLDATQLAQDIETIACDDLWELCVGHDLVGLLCVGLHSKLGSKQPELASFERELRLAFEWDDLKASKMYAALRAWEQAHHAVKVLKHSSDTD